MRGKEAIRQPGIIALATKERERIWQACQQYVAEYCHDENHYLCEVRTRILFAQQIAEALLENVKKESFSMSDMESLFGVPRGSQMHLVHKGLSPARLRGRYFVYSRKAAGELLTVEELRTFYDLGSINNALGLSDKHFLYWTVKKGIGEFYPKLPSKN